jgi:purine-binding chemotaxis protein CheW
LSEEKYGLQILKVQEIIGLMHITQVPQSPSYIKGVINLRGKIIPVVDLRVKFDIESIPYDEKTCIIVVECNIAGKVLSVGVVVDTVLEVMTFDGSKIEPAPDFGKSLETGFILGMGRTTDNNVIILIDIDLALSDAASALNVAGQVSGAAAAAH